MNLESSSIFDSILISSLDAELVKNIMDSSPMAVRISSPGAKQIVYANPVYISLMGFKSLAEVKNIDPSSYYANIEDFNVIKSHLKIKAPVKDKVIELALPNNVKKWVIASYFPSTLNDSPVEIAWFYDITESVNQRKNIEALASFDHLTGLYNRVSFSAKFEEAMATADRSGIPVALAYLDLDGFKAINDTYGHDFGDLLLKSVSSRIQDVMKPSDILSRLGGDEFALLVSDIKDSYEFSHYLDRILRMVDRPFVINNKEVRVSASIGITIYPDNRSDFDTLLRHADQAMYQAKNSGKNKFVLFDIEHSKKLVEKRKVQEEVSLAIDNDHLVLYFQPQVSLKSQKVIGFEALVRWNHPEKGVISPNHFLPPIENSEVELQLGAWVIKSGFNQLVKWHSQGLDFKVSVNVTSDFLMDSEFISFISELVKDHPASLLNKFQLEIVESSAFTDIKSISKVVSQCVEKGLRVSLDDFGTGYSSLSHLRHLTVSQVKIDKSFVMNMVDDQNDYYTVKGVLGLSDTFHLSCVAEGVESCTHGELLVALGCEIAQGFYLSRPMPASQVPEWAAGYVHPEEWSKLIPFFGNKNKAELIMLQMKVNKWIERLEAIHRAGSYSFQDMEFVDYASLFFKDWLESARKGELTLNISDIEIIIDQVIHLGLKVVQSTILADSEDAGHAIEELNQIKLTLDAV